MKKTFTFFLTVFIGVSMLYAQTPHSLEKVTEGENVFWIIDTPQDLIWLSDIDTLSLDADNDGTIDFDSLEAKMDANYRLGADIVFDPDPANVDWNNDGIFDEVDALGLHAIGGDGSPNFTGHFDGQYYAIENAYKNNPASVLQRVSMFGSVTASIIENLHLKNFNFINSEDYGGAIAARATYGGPSIFRRIYVEGSYNTEAYLGASVQFGGIVGRLLDGEVTECVAKVTVTANITSHRRSGAIVGFLESGAVIKNCYSVSTLISEEQVGQIVGYVNGEDANTAIENCYAAGLVSGADPRDERGSFAGQLGTVAPVSCYFDMTLDDVGVGAGANAANVIGLTTSDFGTESNFVGWDFDKTWKMGLVNGVTRPYLQWQDLKGGGGAVSVKNIDTRQLIKVYPNPVSTNLTIENAPINVEYSLINIMGQTQKSGIITSKSMILDIKNYKRGTYLLKVGNNVSRIIVK